MNCPTELTWSMYADGELPEGESHTARVHLSGCPRCRELLDGLLGENRLLSAVLGAEAEEEVARVTAPAAASRLPGWAAAAALAGVAALRAGAGWFAGYLPQGPGDWLNPLTGPGRTNLFFSGAFFLMDRAPAMLAGYALAVALLVSLTVAALLLAVSLRSRRVPVMALLGLWGVLALPHPGTAFEMCKAEAVTVGPDQTVEGTMTAFGSSVSVDGVVDGDLVAFANRILVRGTVRGNLYAFAKSLEISGTVEGGSHVFAQSFGLDGEVKGNIYASCGEFRLDPQGRARRDVFLFSDGASLEGEVGRDFLGMSHEIFLHGRIGRDLKAVSENVTLDDSARVGRNLILTVDDKAHARVADGAVVGGATNIGLKRAEREGSRYARLSFYVKTLLGFLAAALVGVLILFFFPALLGSRMTSAGEFFKTLGLGFLYLVAAPIALVLVAVTLIGIPAALIGAAAYLVSLYLAKVLVGAWVGERMLRPPAERKWQQVLALLAGLGMLAVATKLPWIGVWIGFLVVLLGLGMLARQLSAAWSRGRLPG